MEMLGSALFPEGEEVLVCGFGRSGITCHRVRTNGLEVSEGTRHKVQHNASVVQQFLELGSCGSAVVQEQVGFAAHLSWVQGIDQPVCPVRMELRVPNPRAPAKGFLSLRMALKVGSR
jgi:hypothetical protein